MTGTYCPRKYHCHGEKHLGIIWTIIIGFVAGVAAKFLMPGNNEP